jgi:hypothetical protein
MDARSKVTANGKKSQWKNTGWAESNACQHWYIDQLDQVNRFGGELKVD